MPANVIKPKTPNLDETRGPLNSIADATTRRELEKLWSLLENRLDAAGKDPGYRLVRLEELQALKQQITYQTLKPSELPPEQTLRVAQGDGGGEPGAPGAPGAPGTPGAPGAPGAPGTPGVFGFGGAAWLTLQGPGGGGGSTSGITQGGGGGGAGEACDGLPIFLTPGASYSYNMPAATLADNDGGTTTFGAYSCAGGKKGTHGSGSRVGGVGGGAQGGTGGTGGGGTGAMGNAEAPCHFGGGGGGGGQSAGSSSGPGAGSGGYNTGGLSTSSPNGSGGGGAATIYDPGGNGGGAANGGNSGGYGSGGGGAGGFAGGKTGGTGGGGYGLLCWPSGSVEFLPGQSGIFIAPT